MRFVIAAVIATAGCYRPTVGDCEYACATSTPQCPEGLTCDGDGFCREPGATEACAVNVLACTNPDAGPLSPESCQCDSVGMQQPCFLGDNSAASRCSAGGVVTCESTLRFGACTGATGPAQELCFDPTDSDCDGNVDNGCSCADASNTCLDASGAELTTDTLVFVPPEVPLAGAFTIYVLSQAPLVNLTLQTDTGACTGAGFTSCVSGGRCASWNVQQLSTTAKAPFFTSTGAHTVKVHVGDTGNPGPCVNFAKTITGSITITP
ncbi:MAG: hypothetical protein ABI867_44465 [Kofleriaceae bacterium]